MTEEINQPIVMQSEGIKLIKNSKGYAWEIKLLTIDINRLEELNNKMIEKFEENYNEM